MPRSTVRPAATSAWPATWPPKTRCRFSCGLRPRKTFTSSSSRSRSAIRPSSALPTLRLQPRLVRGDERAQLVGEVEELEPLLLVERHREAPESVDGDAALLAHLDRHAAARGGPLEPLVLRAQARELRVRVLVRHRPAIAGGLASSQRSAGASSPTCATLCCEIVDDVHQEPSLLRHVLSVPRAPAVHETLGEL